MSIGVVFLFIELFVSVNVFDLQEMKERFYYCQTSSFLIQRRDIMVNKRTYQPYTLVGPPV